MVMVRVERGKPGMGRKGDLNGKEIIVLLSWSSVSHW
jgi:hypothetical protein